MKSKTITLANFKGGVGKTTSALNIAAGLHRKGGKVLLIDIDPQHNLSQALDREDPGDMLYQAMRGEGDLVPIQVEEGLDIIPATVKLRRLDVELSTHPAPGGILGDLLKPLKKKYNWIVIDSPPSLGLLTVNAFFTADSIYTPVEAQYLALRGFATLEEEIATLGLKISRVFVTKYDGRKVLHRQALEGIRAALEGRVLSTVVRENIALAEAPVHGQSIFQYAPNSYGAEDYTGVCNEISTL